MVIHMCILQNTPNMTCRTQTPILPLIIHLQTIYRSVMRMKNERKIFINTRVETRMREIERSEGNGGV